MCLKGKHRWASVVAALVTFHMAVAADLGPIAGRVAGFFSVAAIIFSNCSRLA